MSSKQKGKSIAAGSTSDQSPIEVTAVWDEENTKLPPNYDPRMIIGSMNTALKHYNPRYQVNELTAYGPKKPRGIESYGIKYEKIKTGTVRCQGDPKAAGCYEFVVNDPTKSYEQLFRNTDVADVQIHIHMIMKILMGKKDVLLIAGDMDYTYIMKQFPRTNFLLALNDKHDVRLTNRPLAIWKWTTGNSATGTMLEGAPPTHRNHKNRQV